MIAGARMDFWVMLATLKLSKRMKAKYHSSTYHISLLSKRKHRTNKLMIQQHWSPI